MAGAVVIPVASGFPLSKLSWQQVSLLRFVQFLNYLCFGFGCLFFLGVFLFVFQFSPIDGSIFRLQVMGEM